MKIRRGRRGIALWKYYRMKGWHFEKFWVKDRELRQLIKELDGKLRLNVKIVHSEVSQ